MLSRTRGVPLTRKYGSRSYSAPSAVTSWIQDILSRPAKVTEDFIDLNRAQQLHRTLPFLRQSPLPEWGDHLREGHHLVYFQPQTWQHDLGEDGSSTEYNAPDPYLRRMWAGGKMQFHQSARMQIGMHVTEHCSVSSAMMKKDMLFVDQKRVFTETGGNGTPLITEIRTHVFRPRLSAEERTIVKASDLQSPSEPAGASMESTTPSSSGQASYTLTPTSALLFRFSALTFNGHRIHYDHDWTRSIEGHRDVVFHGPLSAVALIEMSRRALEPARKLDTFSYRATRPMYTGVPILFESRTDEAGNIESFAQQGSTVGMKAVATAGAATVGSCGQQAVERE